MSSEVLERQLDEQADVQVLHISPLDPDCKQIIEDAARDVATSYNKQGWTRGDKRPCLRGESLTKTEEVNVHPLDEPGSGAGKGHSAYFITKLGKLYSGRGHDRPLVPVRLQTMDLMERKRIEVLLGLNLRAR